MFTLDEHVSRIKSSSVAEKAAQCCVRHFLLVNNTDIDYVVFRTVSKGSRIIGQIFALEWKWGCLSLTHCF